MNKQKLFVGLSIVGAIGSGVAAGVATYKAYPKIKKAQEEHMGFFKTIKYVGKEYIPAIVAVGGTVGSVIATEVLGEQKARELEYKFNNAKRSYNKVKTMYKDQTEAIKTEADEATQKKIEDKIENLERARRSTCSEEVKLFYDANSGKAFKTTESKIYDAVDAMNRDLAAYDAASYKNFYDILGEEVPEDQKDDGWSCYTCEAQQLIRWIYVSFEPGKVPGTDMDCMIFYFQGEDIYDCNNKFGPMSNNPQQDYLDVETWY